MKRTKSYAYTGSLEKLISFGFTPDKDCPGWFIRMVKDHSDIRYDSEPNNNDDDFIYIDWFSDSKEFCYNYNNRYNNVEYDNELLDLIDNNLVIEIKKEWENEII